MAKAKKTKKAAPKKGSAKKAAPKKGAAKKAAPRKAAPENAAKKEAKTIAPPLSLTAKQHETAGVSYMEKVFKETTADDEASGGCTAVCYTEHKNLGSFPDAASAWKYINNVHLKDPKHAGDDCDVICKNPPPTT